MAMGYGDANAAPKAVKAGLSTDLDEALSRLANIRARLNEVSDRLFGSVPVEMSGSLGQGRPVTTIASRSRDIADLIGEIETTLSRVENAL